MTRIQAVDFSVDLLRALLWQYNDAARLEGLLRQKQAWYDENQSAFWSNWLADVFDLRTVTEFGCAVWAIILDVPLSVSTPEEGEKPTWGFGTYRENFTNGNFSSTQASGLTLAQKRIILQLRYFQLVNRGAVPEINAFFLYLFGRIGGPLLAPGLYDYPVDSLQSFYRGSTATFTDENGVLRTAPANVARYVGGQLLIEASGKNRLLYSSMPSNAAWVKLGCSVGADGGPAPDGMSTAQKIANNAGAVSLTWQNATVLASATADYYATVFVKRGTSPGCTLNCFYAASAEDNVTFNFDTGTVSGAPYPGEYTFDALADGWYRIGFRLTRDATGAKTSIAFRLWGSLRGTGQIGDVLPFWGAQLEAGAAPSSYVPTLSSAVTRAADAARLPDSESQSSVFVADGLDMTARYIFNAPISSDLEMVFTEYDLLPRPAGVKIDYAIIGDADGWGFGRYHENFTNGNFDHA